MLDVVEVQCPTCFELTAVQVDVPEGRTRLAVDCDVCCRPLHVNVEVRDGYVVSAQAGSGW
tara:strand:- start:100 stop:282 length:183 start_codon:yes stop_codon:yes gene_type:complete